MKRSMIFLAIVASMLIVPQVRAEDTTPTPTGIRQEIRQERQELKAERQDNRTTIQTMRGKFNTTRASMRSAMLIKKYAFINQRFDNIISRFEDRLALFEKPKVASTQKLLDAASDKLDTAKEGSAAVIAKLGSVTFTSTKADFDEVKVLVKKAEDSYKAVNDALKLALKELKTVSKPALPASSAAVKNTL